MTDAAREGEVPLVAVDGSPTASDGTTAASAAPPVESAGPPPASDAPWAGAAQTWANAAPPAAATGPVAHAAVCEVCRTAAPSLDLVGSHLLCAGCAHQLEVQLEALKPTGSGLVRGAVWGSAFALIGAIVWAAFAIATGFEIGYAACLVGVLAGVGVKRGASPQRGRELQWLAVAVAVFGMLAAKYAMFAYAVVDIAQQRGRSIGYFDDLIVSNFPEALRQMLDILDLLFVALAVRAAYRVPRPDLREITVPTAAVVTNR